MPKPIYIKKTIVPASYMNFFIANKIVLLPIFNDKNDSMRKPINYNPQIQINNSTLLFGDLFIHRISMEKM